MMALTLAGVATRARADLFNPADFTSLGTLNLSAGSYTINTTTDQLLDSSNKVVFQGVTSGGVAVFDFRSIGLSGVTINVSGSDPLALLSQGNISIGGASINLASGSVGGGGAESGPGAGGSSEFGGGGGGFGGSGGGGYSSSGGATYGDLTTQLVGGSGGGQATRGQVGGGGGGGGAIELGAARSLTITGGTINANGGGGGANAGGGSGGAIVLNADSVSLSGSDVLNVSGGGGGFVLGGGGGGGRILIATSSYSNSDTIFNLSGGGANTYAGAYPGATGLQTLDVLPSPEPSTAVLLATALPLVAAYAVWRRRRMLALA